jgi:hypothetical protein
MKEILLFLEISLERFDVAIHVVLVSDHCCQLCDSSRHIVPVRILRLVLRQRLTFHLQERLNVHEMCCTLCKGKEVVFRHFCWRAKRRQKSAESRSCLNIQRQSTYRLMIRMESQIVPTLRRKQFESRERKPFFQSDKRCRNLLFIKNLLTMKR